MYSHFSGSDVPTEEFLKLRALYRKNQRPNDICAVLRGQNIINGNNVSRASSLVQGDRFAALRLVVESVNEDLSADERRGGCPFHSLPTLGKLLLGKGMKSTPATGEDEGEGITWYPRVSEAMATDYLIAFCQGLAVAIDHEELFPASMAGRYEDTLSFGSVTGRQYKARIDGSIPYGRLRPNEPPHMVIFESKRKPLTLVDEKAFKQKCAEHIALAERKHSKNRARRVEGHTCMLSQHGHEMYLSISSYNEQWLRYIYSKAATTIDTNSLNKFITINEYGPYLVDGAGNMAAFATGLVALILAQPRDNVTYH
ncbi:hypothetical protein KEM55_003707 [Ascosphaera atra]|nr:hypothetical protein KEM55_003707 [Ascosphaera atra]